MKKYNTSQKVESERAKYKVKCECGHVLIFTPSNKKKRFFAMFVDIMSIEMRKKSLKR